MNIWQSSNGGNREVGTRGLTDGDKVDVVGAELGGRRELLPHRPVLAFTIERNHRRMMLHLCSVYIG